MFLGVDYYPEHWDKSMMDDDIKRIKKMGSNIVRIGEFAWHLMEPVEGQYDFTYFDEVISKLKESGLKIMFGTPTATFPAWLHKKHPEIMIEDINGVRMAFGGRRQYCYNSPEYREYSKKIVERLVKYYADEEDIISWQIDNEFGHESSDMCYCPNCQREFQNFLSKKYKDIDELNKIWGTIFWGQTYNDFSEIPVPKNTITVHNPAMHLDWARFRSYSLVDFADYQINIVKELKGDHQTITHNLPGGFFGKYFKHEDLVKNLDFVSYDNYPVWGGLKEPVEPAGIAAMHDYCRGLKNQNFWIVEELMGAQGHDVIGYLPRPNQAKMWSYQAFAHGCESMLYFRYRGQVQGAEQYCLGIIDSDNAEGRKYQEVKSCMEEIKPYSDVLKSQIKSEIACVYDFDNVWAWRVQSQSTMFNMDTEMLRVYRPFYNLNTNIDMISVDKPIDGYKVLLMPVMSLCSKEKAEQLDKFVRDGGTLILTFRTGTKDKNNNINFGMPIPGYFAEMAGVEVHDSESFHDAQTAEIEGKGKYEGKKSSCTVWRDILDCTTAEPLYMYTDKFYSDKACVTVNKHGKGKVYYVGAGVGDDVMMPIARELVKEYEIKSEETELGLEVITREYSGEEYKFIMNHTEEEKTYKNMIFRPYESKVIKASDL